MIKLQSNLLECGIQYITHQCNCVSRNCFGLAKSIFDRFPYANTYDLNRIAGQISVHGDGTGKRYIINMYAQVYPGKPKFPDSSTDGIAKRQQYFAECLKHISQIPQIQAIAFPEGIGCGLAGGDWNIYQKMISDFSEYSGIETYILSWNK